MRPIAAEGHDSEITRRNDAELVPLIVGGDSTALGALYDRHAAALMGVAYHLVRSTTEAEDVVHDVFVGLPEALRRYEERGALRSWLKRVTVRVALSRLRREVAHPVYELDATIAAPASATDAGMDLDAAVGRLTPSLRAVLVLKEIEGYSHVEIADMIGISVAASKVRLHRALRILRAMLEEPGR